MNVSEYLVESLIRIGVDTIFCVPGTHICKLIDEAGRKGIRIILTRHEQGATFMADGFNRMNKKIPGVVIATVGPGVTNTISGLSLSFQDYSRVLLISPQLPESMWGRGGLQETSGLQNSINVSELLRAVTKSSLLVKSPEDFENLPLVFNNLLNGRPGSCAISICCNLWTQEVRLRSFKHEPESSSCSLDTKKIADVINQTLPYKSLVLIGHGAVLSPDAKKHILEFLQKTGYPFITTYKAKGFISESHPQYRGIAGIFGHSHANDVLFSEKDLLISFGVSFSEFFTNQWNETISKAKEFINVDIDPEKVSRIYKPTIAAICDVANFLKNVNPLVTIKANISANERSTLIHGRLPPRKGDTIQPQYLMRVLSNLLPESAAIFCDIGCVLIWTESFLSVTKEQSFFVASNFASMGYAIPAAIGGKIANPSIPVLAICGDGGFHMTGMELLTAKQEGVPITVIVLDNKRLDLIYSTQKRLYGGRYYGTRFTHPLDFEYVAQAFGVKYIRPSSLLELEEVWGKAPINREPILFHMQIDPDETPSLERRISATLKAQSEKIK